MRSINNKKIFIISLFVIVITTFGLILFTSIDNQTPYDYLKMNYTDITAPSKLLYQETLDTGDSIVFYINQRGKYNCVIMENTFVGFKIIGCSGSLDLDDTDTYLYGSFIHNQKKIDICWGILVDQSISQVYLNNEPCVIVDVEGKEFRIFWLLGNWNDVPTLTLQ